jgi:hypothetical protein
MRLLFVFISFSIAQLTFAQTSGSKKTKKESCSWLETIVKAAINGYSAEKGALQRSYKADYDMDGIYNFDEYYTSFLWPGTTTNLIEVSASGIEDEQTISLVSRYEKTGTKEKAYAQLKKLYSELTPCVITPLPGQRVRAKNNILPLAKAMTAMSIVDTIFNFNGLKRRIKVTLGLKEDTKKYFAEMRVSLLLRDEEVIIPKCKALSDVIRQLSTNFSGNYDNVIFSENLPIANGVTTETTRYKARAGFPGSSGAWIENSKIKKNGVTRRDSWGMKSWYSTYSYENALSKYKKLYSELSGCSIVTPAGRQLQLKGEYSEPATMLSGNKKGIIDFKTSTESEQFFISISLEKDDKGYFVWVSVTGAKKF